MKTNNDRLTQAFEAMRLARENAGDERNVRGVIECPRCAGTLRYSIAKNGHLHGRCDTPGCLAWMQ